MCFSWLLIFVLVFLIPLLMEKHLGSLLMFLLVRSSPFQVRCEPWVPSAPTSCLVPSSSPKVSVSVAMGGLCALTGPSRISGQCSDGCCGVPGPSRVSGEHTGTAAHEQTLRGPLCGARRSHKRIKLRTTWRVKWHLPCRPSSPCLLGGLAPLGRSRGQGEAPQGDLWCPPSQVGKGQEVVLPRVHQPALPGSPLWPCSASHLLALFSPGRQPTFHDCCLRVCLGA